MFIPMFHIPNPFSSSQYIRLSLSLPLPFSLSLSPIHQAHSLSHTSDSFFLAHSSGYLLYFSYLHALAIFMLWLSSCFDYLHALAIFSAFLSVCGGQFQFLKFSDISNF